MIILVLALVAILFALIGRLVFGSWFNHASHYSLIWGISLVLFELRLIDYYRLEAETWVMIGSAWLAFVAGSFIVPLGGYSSSPRAPVAAVGSAVPSAAYRRILRNLILLLSGLALVAVVQHWMILIEKFGSIANVIVLGNIVYSLRLSEGIEVGIPYLDSLALTASLLGGVYASLERRFSFVAMIPLLVVIAEAIGLMGRMKILIAVILFLAGYFIMSRRDTSGGNNRPHSMFRRWAVVGLAVLLFAVAGEVVRSKRGIEESIPGAKRTLGMLKTSSFITPSIYLYLTVHHGVFNQYLRKDEERHVFGANTFAPFYRVLSSLGYNTGVSQYEKFYPTPVNANSGSYLREIHGDFGIIGIFIIPFLLGFVCSIFWMRVVSGGGLIPLFVFAHLIVIVDLSTMIMGTRLGYWLVSLIASVGSAWYLEYRARRMPV